MTFVAVHKKFVCACVFLKFYFLPCFDSTSILMDYSFIVTVFHLFFNWGKIRFDVPSDYLFV